MLNVDLANNYCTVKIILKTIIFCLWLKQWRPVVEIVCAAKNFHPSHNKSIMAETEIS